MQCFGEISWCPAALYIQMQRSVNSTVTHQHSFHIIHKDETDTTMEDARRALVSGRGEFLVCTATRQHRARGRLPGRTWVDDGREDLLFTAAFPKSRVRTAYPLTQLLALALCRHLESAYRLSPQIRWPNDVYVNGGKIAGILVEIEGEYYLAGMGLNIRRRFFPTTLRHPATTLVSALGLPENHETMRCEPSHVLDGVLFELERLLLEKPMIGEVQRRLALRGESVKVAIGNPSRYIQGMLVGLKDDGALLVDTGGSELQEVYSGEIS